MGVHTSFSAINSLESFLDLYIKPNFPGRCNHICNGGFITNKLYRGKGVAQLLARSYLRIAKDLNYNASMFNLVFANNKPSIKIWQKLGFKRIGTIPNAAKLKNISNYIDAHQYYFDLTNYNHKLYPLSNVFQYDATKQNKPNYIQYLKWIFVSIAVLLIAILFYRAEVSIKFV